MPVHSTNSESSTRAGDGASTYVALDSWVYPDFDRLIALSALRSSFSSLRPWTRMECAALLLEMKETQAKGFLDEEETALYAALASEFALELGALRGGRSNDAQFESIYLSTVTIAGKPLNDSFHFAQTRTNDFGRPYGQNFNSYAGTSVRMSRGPFAVYLRAELQHAGTPFSISPSVQAAIAQADFTPLGQLGPVANITRGRLLDAYGSLAFSGNQVSFGKQSLWWGPGKGGPLLWSDNAEPLTMLRYDRTKPIELPSIGGWLGPIRVQFFIGRLCGQQYAHSNDAIYGQPGMAYPDQPYIHGEKVSFKPTQNFEFSVSRTAIFGGPGFPVTIGNFWRSFVSAKNAGGLGDPGDRRSAFDFSYRVPWLRDWLTVYADTFTDDQPFPLAYPKDSAWSPGIYMPKLPRLPKMDFRAEGFLTPPRYLFSGFYYFNVRYLSGYTNNRQLIGSWIGREGDGLQLWSTWWFSPKITLQGSYRHMSANPQFLRGGSLNDMTLTSDYHFGRDWSVRVSGQYERWKFPLLSPNLSSNFSTSAQLNWSPSPEAQ